MKWLTQRVVGLSVEGPDGDHRACEQCGRLGWLCGTCHEGWIELPMQGQRCPKCAAIVAAVEYELAPKKRAAHVA